MGFRQGELSVGAARGEWIRGERVAVPSHAQRELCCSSGFNQVPLPCMSGVTCDELYILFAIKVAQQGLVSRARRRGGERSVRRDAHHGAGAATFAHFR